MPEYTEFVKKTQTDILNAVKQAQETNLKAMSTFGDAISEYAAKAKSFAPTATMPTVPEMIESSFDFTAQLIDLQKHYYIRMAEAIATAQKKAVDVASPAKKSDK